MVVMDGLGCRDHVFGNAVKLAATPNLDWLKQNALSTQIHAHGQYVGLPSNSDIGNSEVGHNVLGCGRIFPQGATLVKESIAKKTLYQGDVWQQLISTSRPNTLHFIGLLSDGGVHSHKDHLNAMLEKALEDGVKKIRLHILFDGRDVEPLTREKYALDLESKLTVLRKNGCDVEVASGGGRMHITMDRYGADWQMVKRGWYTHCLGEAVQYASIKEVFKKNPLTKNSDDQYFPSFVIAKNGKPIGTIEDGDGVVFFNYRGDRAVELCQAFEQENFKHFERKRVPKVFFAGMTEYDGDAKIPKNYLVGSPQISDTLSEYLIEHNLQQFACSETQKFGHVTYFWNGNRSGYLDEEKEEYLEIPSDEGPFNKKPWMKAFEITDETIKRLQSNKFDFYRINLANCDMVGHTGDLEATIIAVATVDLMVGRLLKACKETSTNLIVTADHGNSEEMFLGKEENYPSWEKIEKRPPAKTAHSLSKVPLLIWQPEKNYVLTKEAQANTQGLSNLASTVISLLGLPENKLFDKSLVTKNL